MLETSEKRFGREKAPHAARLGRNDTFAYVALYGKRGSSCAGRQSIKVQSTSFAACQIHRGRTPRFPASNTAWKQISVTSRRFRNSAFQAAVLRILRR